MSTYNNVNNYVRDEQFCTLWLQLSVVCDMGAVSCDERRHAVDVVLIRKSHRLFVHSMCTQTGIQPHSRVHSIVHQRALIVVTRQCKSQIQNSSLLSTTSSSSFKHFYSVCYKLNTVEFQKSVQKKTVISNRYWPDCVLQLTHRQETCQ